MQVQSFPPLVEAFLVIEQPRQRLSHWTQALAPLDSHRAPPLAGVNGYYDPSCDQALLGVSYDELALGKERLAYVIEVAVLAEIGMIQPAELSDGDRRRFLGDRLARCTVTVARQRNVVGAFTELVRRLREAKPSREIVPPSPPIPMFTKRAAPTDPEILIVQPRSTRDDLAQIQRAQIEALAPTPSARPRIGTPPPIPPKRRTSSRHVIVRAGSPAPAVDVGRERLPTAQMDPLELLELAALDPSPPLAPAVATGSQALAIERPAEPYPPGTPLPPGSIYARYLRSGRWVPVRIGALSLRGAALLAGALPRLRDQVEIALAYDERRALVSGPVHKISTHEEAARRGAPGFSIVFELDSDARRQLTLLLQAARAANVTIKPPPPRGNRRYPVEWPVCLGTARGSIRAEALDISSEGMFVRQLGPLPFDGNLSFSVVLDDRGSPVSGRTRVVRFIDETGARSCGQAPGYGLQIVDMAEADRERWTGFLGRVERRAERRVLIGASKSRMRELQGGLAAAGYAVAVATDPQALVALAKKDEVAADACLIDAGWDPPGATGTWSEALFPARTVPCVAMRGDVRRAREAIDQVLSIM